MPDLPDFYSPFVVKGWDGTLYRTLRVTNTGELYILLSALYNSTIKGLRCDADGNALLNVKAQDLAEVINRPKYGAGQSSKGTIGTSPTGTDTRISITGKGIIYGGAIFVDVAATHKADYPILATEHGDLDTLTLEAMNDRQMYVPGMSPFWLQLYDEVNFNYCVGVQPGITFETRMELGFHSDVAGGVGAPYYLIFALV